MTKKEIGSPLKNNRLIIGYQPPSSPSPEDTKTPGYQETGSLESQYPTMPRAEESRSPVTYTPKSFGAQEVKKIRKKHSFYLPVGLSKWLKVYAAEQNREISEIATEALQLYKSNLSKV